MAVRRSLISSVGDGPELVVAVHHQRCRLYAHGQLAHHTVRLGVDLDYAGDVAQSMCIYGGKGWIAVNNSHVIFAIDPVTFKELGRIENLTLSTLPVAGS